MVYLNNKINGLKHAVLIEMVEMNEWLQLVGLYVQILFLYEQHTTVRLSFHQRLVKLVPTVHTIMTGHIPVERRVKHIGEHTSPPRGAGECDPRHEQWPQYAVEERHG